MVHVSTAYVNINKAAGTTVHERIYPLMHGQVEVDGELIAQELLGLSKSEADRRADFYTAHWGFPNTYCLGKHLAEQLVFRTQQATGLPVAILRPSLVTGVAGLPYPGKLRGDCCWLLLWVQSQVLGGRLCTPTPPPRHPQRQSTHLPPTLTPKGFIGNYAGPSGMGAAVAIGFFPRLSAHAVNPYSVWDAVPGDMVASAILATAAAVARGLSAEITAATGSGAWVNGQGRPTATTTPTTLTASALAALAVKGGAAGAHGRKLSMNSAFSDDGASLICAGSVNGSGPSGSGTPTPLSGVSEEEEGESDEASPNSSPRPSLPAGSPPVSKGAAATVAAAAVATKRTLQPLLIVHAATSTTYPAIVYEAYNTAVDFLRVHGCSTSILVGGARALPNMPPTWRPSPNMVKFWRVYNGIKVAIVCFLLRCALLYTVPAGWVVIMGQLAGYNWLKSVLQRI